MRGLDGNYINTQGDHSARLQVIYQAEQNRQQVQAQIEGAEALRKLREQVSEIEKQNDTNSLRKINEDGSDPRENLKEKDFSKNDEDKKSKQQKKIMDTNRSNSSILSHIDIRV